MVRDELRRAHLAVAELGMLVDVATPGDHVRLDARARRGRSRAQILGRAAEREPAASAHAGASRIMPFPSSMGKGYRRHRSAAAGREADDSRPQSPQRASGSQERQRPRRAALPRTKRREEARVRSGSWPREAWIPLAARARLEHGRGFARAAVGSAGAAARHVPAQRGRGHAAVPGRPPALALRRAGRRARRAVRDARAPSLGGWVALLLGWRSAAAFVAAGHHALRLDPHPEDVPGPCRRCGWPPRSRSTRRCSARWCSRSCSRRAGDHARIRARWTARASSSRRPAGSRSRRAITSAAAARRRSQLARRRGRGFDFEHLRFASGYEPREGEPGRERWHGYVAEPHRARLGRARRSGAALARRASTAIGWARRSSTSPRSGRDWLHQRLGLNLLLPVLPLHGPRKIGRRSGDGFLGGDVLDTIHAEAQAIWDLRRLLGWVRAQRRADRRLRALAGRLQHGAAGVARCSLACAIAGIPASDFARSFFRHGGPWQERAAHARRPHRRSR